MDWQTEEGLPPANSSNDFCEMPDEMDNDHEHGREHFNALNWKVVDYY